MKSRVKLKKIHFHDTDTEGSWAISYGDMITLLLSFFVIFFSFDFQDENEKKLEESAMKNIAFIDSYQDNKMGISENETAQIEDLNEISSMVTKAADGKLFVFFKGISFFDSGLVSVNKDGESLLDKFVPKYLPYAGKFRIKIQAFTDDSPVSQTSVRFKDNTELSALRSISVMRYLQAAGIPSNRIEIGGKGIMSKRALGLFGIKTDNPDEIKKLSRTVVLILYREDAP